MRFIVRWVLRLIFLLILLGTAVLLLKDVLLKSLLEKRWRSRTGVDVRLGGFELNLLSPVVHFQDFVYYNPAEFGGSPCLRLGEVYAEYYPSALALGKLHYKLVRLEVREIHLVQTSNGKNNLSAIQRVIQESLTHNLPGFEFAGIETLNLSMGKLIFTQLGRMQHTREHELGIQNEIIRDIQSSDTLSSIIVKILWQKALSSWKEKIELPSVEDSRGAFSKLRTWIPSSP